MVVCGLVRCKKFDIDVVYEVIKDVVKLVVYVFIVILFIYFEYKFKMF